MSPKPVGRFIMIGRPLMTIPCATASSRASVTVRPVLLGPSPEMSMTRRMASTPLCPNSRAPKSMAPEIEVDKSSPIGVCARRSEKAADVHGAGNVDGKHQREIDLRLALGAQGRRRKGGGGEQQRGEHLPQRHGT